MRSRAAVHEIVSSRNKLIPHLWTMLVTYITASMHAMANEDSMIGPNNVQGIIPLCSSFQNLQLYDSCELAYVNDRA